MSISHTEHPSPGASEARARLLNRSTIVVLCLLALCSITVSVMEAKLTNLADAEIRFDAQDYLSITRNLAVGRGYLITSSPTFTSEHETAYRTPGYPAFLLLHYWVLGPERFVAGTLVSQNILLALQPAVICLIVFQVCRRREIALTAAVVSFFFVPFRLLANVIQPEFLALFCLLVGVSLLMKAIRDDYLPALFGFSLFFATAIIVRQSLVLLLLVFVLPLPWMLRWRRLLIAGILPALVVGGWVVRNALVLDAFPVFATNGGVNFLLSQHPHVDLSLKDVEFLGRPMESLVRQGLSEAEAERRLYTDGMALAGENGVAWQLRRLAEKLQVTFSDHMPQFASEIFYLILPFALLMTRRRVLALSVLAVAQLMYAWFLQGFILDPRVLYYSFAVDQLVVNAIGGIALVFLCLRWGRSVRLLGVLYGLMLLPSLIFLPLDRVTYVSASILVMTYAMAPLMLGELRGRLSTRSDSDASVGPTHIDLGRDGRLKD